MTKTPTKKTPMTNAEKQAAWRARKIAAGEGTRASYMFGNDVIERLARLASHRGITQADLIKSLTEKEEAVVLEAMKGDRAATKKYRDGG
jgi:predicted DNA-binding ribbon-helix-helix protein